MKETKKRATSLTARLFTYKSNLRGYAADSFATITLLFLTLLLMAGSYGCSTYGKQAHLKDETDMAQNEAEAEDESLSRINLIRYNDPEKYEKHRERTKKYLQLEKERLKEEARIREEEARQRAERLWAQKALAALKRAKKIEQWHNEEVSEFQLAYIESKDREKANNKKAILEGETSKEKERRVLSSLGMVKVEGGCFIMGSSKKSHNKFESMEPHKVCLNDFYIGRNEVTSGEYREFVDETGYVTDAEHDGGCYLYTASTWYKSNSWFTKKNYNWRDLSYNQTDDHPVACVSWNDANAYIQWKSAKSGIQYRLPSEAEWEYAAKSGGKNERYAGTNDAKELGIYAWYSGNSNYTTHPVGMKKSNLLGLFDMSGNVWEWMQDRHSRKTSQGKSAPKDDSKMVRGGSWYSLKKHLTTTIRVAKYKPTYRDFALGFRLGMDGQIKPSTASSVNTYSTLSAQTH